MYALILAAALLAAPPAAPVTAPVIKSLDTLDVAERLRRDANLLLVDLRSESDFTTGHIPHAVNYPWQGEGAAKSLAKLEMMFKLGARSVVIYGADPLTLSSAAARVARLNPGLTAIYPGGVGGWADSGGYLEIEWPGIWGLLTHGTPQVFDVRPAEDFAAGHLPGALHYDPQLAAEPAAAFIAALKKAGRPVVVYCGGEMCSDSRRLAARLAKAGAGVVYQFPGGYPEWVENTACLPD